MKTTKKLTALMAAFIFAFAFAVVKPEKVQAAGYTITVTGGTATKPDGTTITSAEEGNVIRIIPTAVAGKYVTSWMASPTVTWGYNEGYGRFEMPAANVTLTPNYEKQTALNVDLSGDAAIIDEEAVFGLMQIYYPSIYGVGNGEVFEFDLDGDDNNDVKITYYFDDPMTVKKLSSTNLTGTYSVTEPNTSPYSPINFKFGDGGNTGGGNNPANEDGATTGETPADPNKAPKTGESNAFVLSMLGIIAVAGMGLYVGKRQEN